MKPFITEQKKYAFFAFAREVISELFYCVAVRSYSIVCCSCMAYAYRRAYFRQLCLKKGVACAENLEMRLCFICLFCLIYFLFILKGSKYLAFFLFFPVALHFMKNHRGHEDFY